MLEKFKSKLEELEARIRRAREPTRFLHIRFINPDRTEIQSTYVTGPNDFTCHRYDGEALDLFKSRAEDEYRALYPYGSGMPAILVFFSKPPDEPEPLLAA